MAFLLMNNSRSALVLLSCLILSFFYSLALAQNSGTATFYTPFYKRSRVMIAAASEVIWNSGAACGQYYQVNSLGGTNAGTPFPCQGSGRVVVKIVDRCPAPACRGTIDLSQEAFASIADPAAGVVNISYQQV